jgi:hypothetical protein
MMLTPRAARGLRRCQGLVLRLVDGRMWARHQSWEGRFDTNMPGALHPPDDSVVDLSAKDFARGGKACVSPDAFGRVTSRERRTSLKSKLQDSRGAHAALRLPPGDPKNLLFLVSMAARRSKANQRGQ